MSARTGDGPIETAAGLHWPDGEDGNAAQHPHDARAPHTDAAQDARAKPHGHGKTTADKWNQGPDHSNALQTGEGG